MYSVLRSCMLRGLKMETIGFNTAADAVVDLHFTPHSTHTTVAHDYISI